MSAAATPLSVPLWALIVLVLATTGVKAQTNTLLSCPSGWTQYGDSCYRLYTKLLSWQGALEVCQIDGAYLSQVEDAFTNDRLGSIASSSSITNFWIGLNRISVPAASTTDTQWSDGTVSSVYQAFWDDLQPDLSAGDCVYMSLTQSGQYRWTFGACGWKRAFVCERPACPSGNFHCSSGECIQGTRACDGTLDCSDGSDEIDCSSLCKEYVQGTQGVILSANFPGGYPTFSDCQWTIEGPLESNIFLQVNSLDTEAGVDDLIIMGGGKTTSSSYNVARLSGVGSPSAYRSTTNFMIVRFYSNGAVQGTGFNLTWTAVQTGIPDGGQQISAVAFSQQLQSPSPYLTNQETVWIVSSNLPRNIITLKREDIDLASGDSLYVRDGADASAPLLAEYTGTDGPLYVISTGASLYILMKTGKNTDISNTGFRFGYSTGCNLILRENEGEIFSPGYGVSNYANFSTCTYYIEPLPSARTTLRFDSQYDVEYQNDLLQIYLGTGTDGTAIHSASDGGFQGPTAPAPVTANDGRIFVQFDTNAIDSRNGWRATYSISCPVPTFTTETILDPVGVVYDYGDSFNVSCPVGYVFDAQEFYREQQDGTLVSMASVNMECLSGGVWNVQRYPQCVPIYCGQAPDINNGYVQFASGAVFASNATYVCADGYSLTGPSTINCQQDGTWQTPPVCSVLTCPSISTTIAQGTVQLVHGSGLVSGTIYSYSCDTGYVISGSPIIHCNASGLWSHPEPTCEKVQCLAPTLTNGQVLTSGQTFVDYNSVIAVVCNGPAYELVGNATITCLANQTFTSLPTCQDVNECDNSPCPANSECSNTDGAYICTCRPGYQQNGSACDDIDECSTDNGGCSDTCSDTEGSYFCDCPDGYTLYTQNGFMGYDIPPSETGLRFGDTYFLNHTCVRNQCPTPGALANGFVTETVDQYNYEDTITFSCMSGFVLSGKATLLCQANGTWSAELPTCDIAKCPAESVPANLLNPPVSVSPSGDVDFGTSITITCNVSGIGVFTKTRTCRFEPGQQVYRLQGDTYECGVVDCGAPLLPTGGLAFPSPTTTTFGSTFDFYCDFEYDVEGTNNLGSNTVTCAANYYWTFFNITCIKRQCPFPGVPAGGNITFEGNGFDYYDNATFSCQRSGFSPTLDRITCGVSENGQELNWGIAGPPDCVDVEPPTFVDCPSSPVSVSRLSAANFSVPTATDNSGSVASVSVNPLYFYPTEPVGEDMTVTYTATDHAGLSVVCVISIVVEDDTPPSIECPDSEVLRLNSSSTSNTIFDPATAGVVFNSSDATLAFSASIPLNFSYDDVGVTSIVTATATDGAGNSASCQFQVTVQATVCEPDTISSANTRRQCVQTNTGGYTCTFVCESGYFFYEDYESFTTSCEPGQAWDEPYIPSCVGSAQVKFNMAVTLQYEANPAEALSDVCLLSYNDTLSSSLTALGADFKQVCISQTTIIAITYNENSLQSSYNATAQQLTVQFSLLFESQESSTQVELEYVSCFSSLRNQFLSLASDSGSLLELRNLSSSVCPSVLGLLSATAAERSCDSDYKSRESSGVPVCLPCPPGSSKSDTGTCELCSVGEYWVAAAQPVYGQCVRCSRGQATTSEGSRGVQSCIELCDNNFVSSTGVPPCYECTGNSFAVNSTYCQQCPANTLALRIENPLNTDCNRTEARLCRYDAIRSVQMLGSPVQVQILTITECEELCERWETLPFTSSVCVGFNYENSIGICSLYDTQSSFGTNLNYDFYERRCAERNLTDCYCAPECTAGYYSTTGYQPDCLPCPVGYFSPSAAATSCQECPVGQTTASQAATTCVADAVSVVCQNSPCQNNGNCSVLLHTAYCTCQPGYTGRYCEQEINFCASSPCYNGGNCSSSPQGFSCSCPSGFQGDRCEENIDDCTASSCNYRGTCIDGVNSFTCDCVDNYAGGRCEQQVLSGCDFFPCGGNSTCRAVNSYHRVCDCFPGFTGPLCDVEIDECESQPCLNGGTCTDKINGFDCACRSNFTGDRCEQPAQTCGSVSCGTVERCVNDPVTGLPMCVCPTGYTQGELCQYSLNGDTAVSSGVEEEAQTVNETAECRLLCDTRGDQCQAFVYEVTTNTCRLYSSISSTVAVNATVEGPKSLSVKRCFFPRDDYFYTEWFNSLNAEATGADLELYDSIQAFGMTICENTEPVGVECRVADTLGAIPSGVDCDLTGLTCSIGLDVAANDTCPDMEIRFKCARSRVFQGQVCRVRDICSERNTCVNGGTCINDPSDQKGFRCANCNPGYTGDRCQLTTDECAGQPCLNNGTCIDGVLSYTCDCITGFEGDQCETNPDDCAQNACDTLGTVNCVDGLDDYTCVCRPGYSGQNCSVDINDCASNPCFHGATCVDQVNGYTCTCVDGWTGPQCDTVVDQCSPFTQCGNGASCFALFNDFYCSCLAGFFGAQCLYTPSVLQCTNSNPCVNTLDCGLNGTQAICYCADGTTGEGCQVYADDTCDSIECQNGATCSISSSGPVCSCPAGYSGSLCEVNTNECASTSCPATAACIDGIDQAFCRCPVGKASPDCLTDIDENYDMCFSPSVVTAGASLPYSLSVSGLDGLTIIVWVKYDQAGSTGTFLTVSATSSPSATDGGAEVLTLSESGMYINLFGARTLNYNLFPINDGLWHLIVIFWSSSTAQLDLTVDYVRQDTVTSYGFSQTITANLQFVLGGTQNTAPTPNTFEGCVSNLDVLSRGLDFTTDLPTLQFQPNNFQGDLLRWAEFEVYGNVRYVRPSTAQLINCVANPSDAACLTQSRDSTPPEVTSCPEDITVVTIYTDEYASWTEPVFSGEAVAVSSSHQPGALFQRGPTAVVYVAEDQAGNAAVCSFNVFIAGTDCPSVDSPRGGGAQVCQQQSDGFDACTASCPASNAAFVEDVPDYYTCGPSGSWTTLQDQDGLYPSCGRIVGAAQADVSLHMEYQITAGQCPTIAQSIITRGQEELTVLSQNWGGEMCDAADCTDITPVVDCSVLASTTVDIQLTNVSAVMTSGSVQRSVEDVWLNAVLDDDVFSFDTIIPAAALNEQTYSVQVTYLCDEGQVVRDQFCVECGPGTFYNSTTKTCSNCPKGQYMSGYAALSCTSCPQGQTTPSLGSTSSADCEVSCGVGQFYNGSSCEVCPVAFYQNETGQFECKPCPRGYLTLTVGSTSEDSCAEGCESGFELLVNSSCVPCSEGTYRQFGLDQLCKPCPSAYTTPTETSVSADNCTVLKCPAGSRANASITGCELCPVGEYQPLANQQACLPCSVNFTTAQPGSVSSSACQQFCPSGYEVVSGQCVVCPVAYFKDNTVDPLANCTACPVGYLTASAASTSISACSIRNCSAGFFIQSDQQGVETCALCPLDQYNPQPYQSSCLPCPNGTATRQTGAHDVSLCESFCPSGEELVGGVCTQCPQGYYKDNSEDRFGQCSLCPEQFITEAAGATNLSDCNISNCSAGYYREVANNTCMECPFNTYQPDRWQTSCIQCPVERLTDVMGATSEAQCLLSCSPGRQDINGSCEECPVGFFKDQRGSLHCQPCPAGFRTASTGSADEADCTVAACQPGSFLNSTGNNCVPCPYGQYQPDQWQDSCLPCTSGTTTFAEGATSDSQCLTDCAMGSELNLITGVCDPCGRGYYRDKSTPDQTSCVICPVQFITAATGATSASDCNVANCTVAGRYINTDNGQCEMCPVGTYNSQWWADSCTQCPTDFTTKTTGIATIDNCYRDCPSGQQVNETSSICTTCAVGTYRDKALTWTCQPCPNPLSTTSTGSTSVSACDTPTCGPGLYYDETQSVCKQCPVGTFQPQAGQRSCTTCPNLRTTLAAGRTSADDCISVCETIQNICSVNAQCSVSDLGAVQCACNNNYQGNGVTCTHVCDLADTYCLNGATCYTDRSSPCVCAENYSGSRCETRADPSKSASDTEVIVYVVIGVVALLLLLLLILIGIIVRRRRQRIPSDKDSLSTSNSQSQGPSFIYPRINTQSYRNFKPDEPQGRNYDPAYYNSSEADREVTQFAYDNATFR